MYDNVLRERLTNPAHYDRMIALITLHNDACENEEWATRVVNQCISQASYLGDYATGMCAAYKTPSGQIRLFLEPVGANTYAATVGEDIRKRAFERSQEDNNDNR